jgi:hypothetical protein
MRAGSFLKNKKTKWVATARDITGVSNNNVRDLAHDDWSNRSDYHFVGVDHSCHSQRHVLERGGTEKPTDRVVYKLRRRSTPLH